jgi:hypothetical protein
MSETADACRLGHQRLELYLLCGTPNAALILHTLYGVDWVIGGSKGAAANLS